MTGSSSSTSCEAFKLLDFLCNSLCFGQGAKGKRKKLKSKASDKKATDTKEFHRAAPWDSSVSKIERSKKSQDGNSEDYYKEKGCANGTGIKDQIQKRGLVSTYNTVVGKRKEHLSTCIEPQHGEQDLSMVVEEVQGSALQQGINRKDKIRGTKKKRNIENCEDMDTNGISALEISTDSETNSLEEGCRIANDRTNDEILNCQRVGSCPNSLGHNDQESRAKPGISHKPQSKLLVKMHDRLMSGHFRHLNELLYTKSGGESMKMMQKDRGLFESYHRDYQQQMKSWSKQPVDQAIGWLRKSPKHWKVVDFGCGDAKLAASVPQVGKSF